MAETDYKFEGWMGLDKDSVDGKMVWQEFEPKPWEETDVDIKVECCGLCGTDLHTLRSGWASFSRLALYSKEGYANLQRNPPRTPAASATKSSVSPHA